MKCVFDRLVGARESTTEWSRCHESDSLITLLGGEEAGWVRVSMHCPTRLNSL